MRLAASGLFDNATWIDHQIASWLHCSWNYKLTRSSVPRSIFLVPYPIGFFFFFIVVLQFLLVCKGTTNQIEHCVSLAHWLLMLEKIPVITMEYLASLTVALVALKLLLNFVYTKSNNSVQSRTYWAQMSPCFIYTTYIVNKIQ